MGAGRAVSERALKVALLSQVVLLLQGLLKDLDGMLTEDPVVDSRDVDRTLLMETVAELRGLMTYLDESNWKYDQ